jgi:hypothetical protein
VQWISLQREIVSRVGRKNSLKNKAIAEAIEKILYHFGSKEIFKVKAHRERCILRHAKGVKNGQHWHAIASISALEMGLAGLHNLFFDLHMDNVCSVVCVDYVARVFHRG